MDRHPSRRLFPLTCTLASLLLIACQREQPTSPTNALAVSFIKPLGPQNEHPGYADLLTGEHHVMDLVDAIRNGPDWPTTAIVITYDEHGGFWDHVPTPVVDRWGPGIRVPTLVISPFAKRHFVDHNRYDTTSILALIENRWGLEPLSDRDAGANDMANAFENGRSVERGTRDR